VRRTRILLIDMPRMLREVIGATIAEQPDLELVDEIDDHSFTLGGLERARADVVIVGADVLEPSAVAAALRSRPDARVLRVSEDGRETSLWELRPHEQRLGAVSPERLLDAIRAGQQI
jgi:chemotaxis response regulator CheB